MMNIPTHSEEYKALILVVEDNPDLNMAICEILESYNYEIRSASNGLEALEMMQGETPEVILCDIMMPGMDGYTLLQHTRSDMQLRTIPFIFLTALTSSADRRRAKGIGIEDYLTKPVDGNDLVLAIDNALRRQKIMEDEMQRQMDALRNQIVRILQHEFRTPLTFVLGYAEYLQGVTTTNIDLDDLQASAGAILEGGRRLERLIEGFLLLANLQSREMQPDEMGVFNALALWRSAAQDLDKSLGEVGLNVEISTQNDDAMVRGEPELLHEALVRLMDNTIRYRRFDSKQVWVSVQRSGPYIGLCIRDEGIGIPAELVEQLSRPFEQIDRDSRTQQGAGISLPLIHHVARLHGGSFEIHSKRDEGSTFILWLPAILDSDPMEAIR